MGCEWLGKQRDCAPSFPKNVLKNVIETIFPHFNNSLRENVFKILCECHVSAYFMINYYFIFCFFTFEILHLPRILCPRRLPLAPTLYHCNGQTTSSTDRYKYYIRFVIPIAQLGAVDVYNAVDVTPIELYKAIILKISSNDYRLVVQQLQQLICLWKRNLIKNKAFIDARSN